jgi:Bacterial Ig domain/Lamin Tail Domain/CotH kinase protein
MIRSLLSPRLVAALSFFAVAEVALAAPVAVNDAYSTNEDTPLQTGGGPVFSADFEPATNVLAGTWSYLDKIKNSQLGQVADNYPTDGGSRDWRAVDFDTGTSTVGPWGSSPLPIVGGAIDAVTGANVLLAGVSPDGSTPFTVTTYLFRKTFTASTTQAATASWTLRAVADDGAVFYLNGVEIHRVNMDPASFLPAGALSTLTGTVNGNESVYVDTVLDLTGKLVAGTNVLAVEVHQTASGGTWNSSDAGIDCSLSAGGSATGGFSYVDDPFGTNAGNNETGSHLPTGGFNGTGGLYVDIGYRPTSNGGARQSSGAWRRTFTTGVAATVRFTGRYRIMTKGGMETNEWGDFIMDVNGTRYGAQGTAPNLRIERLLGPNVQNLGNDLETDSGWKQFTQDVALAAGTHTLTLGLYNNNSTAPNEHAELYLDDVEVALLSGGNTVLTNDTGGAVTAVLVTTTANGTLNFQSNGGFSYTPASNFNGSDSFTYKASDGVEESNTATVSITVNPVNDAPVGLPESYSTDRDVPLNVPAGTGVLANDTDIDTPQASLTAVLAAPPANGAVTLNPNGSFLYTPAAGYAGADSFSYRATDGALQSNLVTVNITVVGVSAPVGVADDYTMVRNTTLDVSAITTGTTTEDAVPFLATNWRYLDDGSNQGTAWRTAGFDDTTWKTGAAELGYGDGDEATVVEDNPTPGYNAGDTNRFATTYFRRTFNVTDVHRVTNVEVSLKFDDAGIVYINGTQVLITAGLTAGAAFDVYANANNENVTNNVNLNLAASALVEGTNVIQVEIHQQVANSSDISMDARVRLTKAVYAGVLANDTDLESDPLTAVLNAPPVGGAFTLNTNGTFSYTPPAGFVGDKTFTYRANDGTMNSAVTTATIHVISGPNQPPIVAADTYAATEEVQLAIAAPGVLGNDTDGEGDTFTAEVATGISPVGAGALSLNADGSFTFMPAVNFFGAATFTYRARDAANALSAPATVTINVANVNDLPVALNDSYSTDPGVALNIPASGVLGNDTDADGNSLTAVLATGLTPAAAGSLTLNADGSFSFIPAVGFTGTSSFTYRANDGTANSAAAATVTLKINSRPIANGDTYGGTEDVPLTINAPGLLANDSDPESDPLTAILVTPPIPAQGSVTVNPNGSFTFTPALNFNGPATFTYKANDGVRDSLGDATVTINVAPVNDAPSAVADTYGTPLNTPLIVPVPGVLANDTDLEGNSLTSALAAEPTTGTLLFNADGSFTYTPATGFSGQATFSYRANDGAALSTPATVTINVGVVPSNIVINEIMFHPANENDGEEYIELYNKGPIPVDLTGWQFTAGVNFTFPAITIPADGYLVVAANPATFNATYGGVSLLTGPWTGSLANGGETIRLKYPDSSAAGGFSEADQVDFAEEGDWALRRVFTDTESGWDWQCRADGFGDSLELINPLLTNNNGQNWTKREIAAAGNQRTPGARNTDLTANPSLNSAPIITGVNHSPAIPRSTDPVVITAKLADELATGLAAQVFWRTWTPNQTAAPGAFASIAMADNGLSGDGLANDGVFGATIPAQALNTIVEFYVQGSDSGARSRTWPAPTTNGGAQGANCLYQVDETAITGRHPAYRFIATGGDQDGFAVANWNSASNAAVNITFIATQGTDTDIRYLSALRVRGAGSRGRNPRNWKLSFPGDNTYNGQAQANINVWYSYLQFFGAQAMKCANLPHEGSIAVHVRLNGTNYATNTTASYGMYAHMQPIGDTSYDNENFSHDRGGNIYKKVRPHQNFTYRDAGGGVPNINSYLSDGWGKQSNTGENNWTDLHQLLFQLTKAGGYTMADLEGVMDVEQWARAMAFTTIVNDAETNFSNGSSDDFGLYFGITDPRAKMLMHDYDTIFGLGDTGTNTGDGIYQVIVNNGGSSHLTNGEVIAAMTGFYQNPIINQRYKAQLANLLNTVFLPANFDPMLDAELGDWPTMPASVRTNIKNFNTARRTAILGIINGGTFTASTSLAVQNGYPRTTTATNTGLGGATDPVIVRKVLVNGIAVTVDNYNGGAAGAGTWTAGTAITLQPGLNNVVVQALGVNDTQLATQTFTIWYDDSSVVDVASISGNTTWTAAGGPYRVTSTLNIDNETLSIAPGTTVYFTVGAGFNVTGTGRILAEGNAGAHIRLATEPGQAGPWGGITLSGSAQESRFAYVDISGAGNAPVISLANAVGYFSNIGFSNLDEQYFGSTNSSFIFEDTTWPSDTNVNYASVSGIPASGYAIFRRNTFGILNGTTNILTITGGKRPGAIIQILDNAFTGGTDDAIELIGADAHIEGNTFLNVHQVISGADSANAIALARNGAVISEATIVRNLFNNCDHAVLSTGGSIPTVVNNTIVNINNTGSAVGSTAGAFNFHEPARAGIIPGGTGRFDGNIVFQCPLVFENAASASGH